MSFTSIILEKSIKSMFRLDEEEFVKMDMLCHNLHKTTNFHGTFTKEHRLRELMGNYNSIDWKFPLINQVKFFNEELINSYYLLYKTFPNNIKLEKKEHP